MALDDETKAMSHEMARIAHLFEILTSRSDIDHPICIECTALLLSTLEARLEASVRERDAYANYLKELRSTSPTESEIASAKVVYEKARSDEETAMKELLNLEAQRKAIDAEIADLTLESQQLDTAETEFWESHNAFTATLSSHLAERASAAAQLAHDSTQLSKLQRTNVYNDTFNISHDGTFGTINGLRLGRLSTVMVDWPEINAAWGQTLLLLSTVAKRLGFTFKNYELVPMGSTSQIIALTPARRAGQPPKRVVLDLYTSGDMPLGLTFMHRHFDSAMSAFLECLAQVGAFVERETAREGRGLRLPYQIDGDRIGGFSIRLGVSQDDGWGSACKFVLTCCKFLLAHASNVASAGGGRGR
jgi:beclin 1